MPALEDLKNFNVPEAELTLWTFKKRVVEGRPIYTGHWVDTTDQLNAALKDAIVEARNRITEAREYTLLGQNNEASALTIPSDETHANLVLATSMEPSQENKATRLKHLQNTVFYAIKLTCDGRVLYAVRKTESTWKTKKAKDLLRVMFSDEGLDLDDEPRFNLSKFLDFFIIEDSVLITNKSSFESVLNYKQAHISDFVDLKQEDDFASLFSELNCIDEYVGDNKIQLRRASAIRQKGHYKNPEFMESLRKNCKRLGFAIHFDEAGRIVPTPQSCRDIFQALLDHRLMSHFPKYIYDVQDTAEVKIPAANP